MGRLAEWSMEIEKMFACLLGLGEEWRMVGVKFEESQKMFTMNMEELSSREDKWRGGLTGRWTGVY